MKKLIAISVVFSAIILAWPTQAQAQGFVGIGFGGRSHHSRVSFAGVIPFGDYHPVRYYEPYRYPEYYYQPVSYTYVGASAPVGSVLYALPAGSRLLGINGVNYYEYNGTYYLPVAGGYQVVQPPVVVQQAAVVTVPASAPVAMVPEVMQNEFSVNVPNAHGGYTTVTVKRSGNGFVGPQGEFYSEFPKITQLQVMYGK
jgi:hypothetical protein